MLDPSKLGKEAAASYEARECPMQPGSKAATEWHKAYDGTRDRISSSVFLFANMGAQLAMFASVFPRTASQLVMELTDKGTEALVLGRYGHLVSTHRNPLPMGAPQDMINLVWIIQKTMTGMSGEEIHDSLKWVDPIMRKHGEGVRRLAVEFRDEVAGMVIPDIIPGQTAPFTVMYDKVTEWFAKEYVSGI